MAGIYIHIPFCKQACYYCDFHFSTSMHFRQRVLDAIAIELRKQDSYLGHEEIETIYFGGGTPSLLTKAELEHILGLIFSYFKVISNPEITLEANPDDLTAENTEMLRAIGINRLSIGIQSFNDDLLKFFNRAHGSQQSLTSVHLSREAGFNNINLDLIYGSPGQDIAQLDRDVTAFLSHGPEHISAYSLTIEPKTVFGKRKQNLSLIEADEGVVAEQFEYLVDRLAEAGYEQYEVSNFALPGFRSRHNSSYWLGKKYLGIGPSAHSYDGVSRQFNVANNLEYCRSLENDGVWFEKEQLGRNEKVNEQLMTGLRTSWGVDLEKLKKEFAYDLMKSQSERVQAIIKSGHAVISEGSLKLTRSGLLIADKISSDFFL